MRRCVLGWCVAIFALLALTLSSYSAASEKRPAATQAGRPMIFTVVRSSRPGCEPACPEWIYGEGDIVADTPARLEKLLRVLGTRRLPVVLNSPGGDVDAAMAMGRTVRARKLDTAVGGTVFMGCDPRDTACVPEKARGGIHRGAPYTFGATCSSACPLILAGGVRRLAGSWALVGVHQVTTRIVETRVQYREKYRVVNGKKKVIGREVVSRKQVGTRVLKEMGPQTERMLRRYLQDMGIDAALVDVMKSTPSTDIHRIPLDDSLRLKLLTGYEPVEFVTSPQLCKTVPAAGNCRLVTVDDMQ